MHIRIDYPHFNAHIQYILNQCKSWPKERRIGYLLAVKDMLNLTLKEPMHKKVFDNIDTILKQINQILEDDLNEKTAE